jgi:Telomerase activating protein Est1
VCLLARALHSASNHLPSPSPSLRRLYLSLVFDHFKDPSSAPARLLEYLNILWLETTHSFIHCYRQKVAALDRAIASRHSDQQHPQHQQQDRDRDRSQHPPGPTARRRLVHTFRSFLAAEETFWSDLLRRLVRVYKVKEAEPALRALGIHLFQSPNDWETTSEEGQAGGSLSPETAKELCHKVLICFGDLARYRELYNEAAGRGPKKTRGRGGKKTSERATEEEYRGRNWARAGECYHQARLLLPENGSWASLSRFLISQL